MVTPRPIPHELTSLPALAGASAAGGGIAKTRAERPSRKETRGGNRRITPKSSVDGDDASLRNGLPTADENDPSVNLGTLDADDETLELPGRSRGWRGDAMSAWSDWQTTGIPSWDILVSAACRSYAQQRTGGLGTVSRRRPLRHAPQNVVINRACLHHTHSWNAGTEGKKRTVARI